jgi:hypothetical protein
MERGLKGKVREQGGGLAAAKKTLMAGICPDREGKPETAGEVREVREKGDVQEVNQANKNPDLNFLLTKNI